MGQSMVLIHKWDLFHVFIFGKIGKKKSLAIFQKEKRPLQPTKTRSKKNRKIAFLKKGSSMVLVKKWDSFHVFIVGKLGKEKVSVDILEKKTPFQTLQPRSKKKGRKLAFFPKGVSPWFCPKNDSFSKFLFMAKQALE